MPKRSLAFGLLICVLLAACSPSAIASLLPNVTGPLVKVTTRGGECFNGPCGSIIEIARDGTVTKVLPGSTDLGIVPANVLAALADAIMATDFDAIRSRRFTGECPVNFDGQEVIYEFGALGGVERVASCETEIDPSQPVFVAVTAALEAVRAIPTD
jgi:hypothetical protein